MGMRGVWLGDGGLRSAGWMGVETDFAGGYGGAGYVDAMVLEVVGEVVAEHEGAGDGSASACAVGMRRWTA